MIIRESQDKFKYEKCKMKSASDVKRFQRRYRSAQLPSLQSTRLNSSHWWTEVGCWLQRTIPHDCILDICHRHAPHLAQPVQITPGGKYIIESCWIVWLVFMKRCTVLMYIYSAYKYYLNNAILAYVKSEPK